MSDTAVPILVLGAGRMGGAMARGWMKAGAFAPGELAFVSRTLREDAQAAVAAGAQADPQDLTPFKTVLLGVKPQVWREATAGLTERLAPDAVIVSMMAGVRLADLQAVFGERPVVRSVPTTGVAVAQGVCALHGTDARALARAHALFDPVAVTSDLPREEDLEGATAIAGCAPAYFYALVEALETAGTEAGLERRAAETLARAAMVSAAALLRETQAEPAELRRQVTSPNGVTAAALEVLMAEDGGFPHLARGAVAAAVRRARELGGS